MRATTPGNVISTKSPEGSTLTPRNARASTVATAVSGSMGVFG